MATIAPCLWLEDQAAEAAAFYTELFPSSSITATSRYPQGIENPSGSPPGSIMAMDLDLDGTPLTLLNGGPAFVPNPSISFILNFDPSRDPEARETLAATWEALIRDGQVRMPLDAYPFSDLYGWVEDRFGANWQLMLTDPDGEPRPFVVPSLMFVGDVAGRAEEALELYTAVFDDAQRGVEARYPAGMDPEVEGTLMFADLKLEDLWIAAMDSAHPGHAFSFDEGVSLRVLCEDQEEVDRLWEALQTGGGEASVCGWLKDRFGLSWQIIPQRLVEIMVEGEPGSQNYQQVFRAMLEMGKLDLAALEAAYEDR